MVNKYDGMTGNKRSYEVYVHPYAASGRLPLLSRCLCYNPGVGKREVGARGRVPAGLRNCKRGEEAEQ